MPADKWLDWRSLASLLVNESDRVHKIHYFKARTEWRESDPEQGLRQETYFRVLRRVPGIEFHYGLFKRRSTYGELIYPKTSSQGLENARVVKVNRYEEKGSDVNLATQLVEDSFIGDIEHAVVVSNDTDLISPIISARKRIRVSVISPHIKLAPELAEAANAAWKLDCQLLRMCRLPVPAPDEQGELLTPPDSWMGEVWPSMAHDYPEEVM